MPVPTAPAATPGQLTATRRPSSGGTLASDPVVQTTQGSRPAPTATSFEGVGNLDSVIPPDTNGAVGPTYYVQWVNLHYAVFNKDGSIKQQALPGNDLWSAFQNSTTEAGLCWSKNQGDPIVRYDAMADRWIFTQFAFQSNIFGTPKAPYVQCFAVSQTNDPTGAYYDYAYDMGSYFPDYPKLGVWSDAYYLSFNAFSGNTFVGASAVAFPRSTFLTGGTPANTTIYQGYVPTSYDGLLPADVDGTTPPPTGEPGTFIGVDTASPTLEVWQYTVNWSSGTSAFKLAQSLTTAAYSGLCGITSTACIPQPGTSQTLDPLADRLMYRLAYRNFGTYESMVVDHSVNVASSGNQAGVRWYEIRHDNSATTDPYSIFQQGTYAPDSDNRWMGSVALDAYGDIAMGYSVSSGSTYPSIRYTGRLAGDPAGQMTVAEGTLQAGGGSQTGYARWGDYSAMSIDPDGCTFWYTNEYYPSSASYQWHTRIGHFVLPGCGSTTAPSAPTGLTATPTAGSDSQIDLSWTASTGATSYTVDQSTDSTFPTGGVTSAVVSTTTYSETGLAPNTTYYYRVYASNSYGTSTGSASAQATTNPAPPPQPTGLTATPVSSGEIDLAWTGSNQATSYTVAQSTDSTFQSGVTSATTTSTSYQETGLAPSTTYYYEVTANDAGGSSAPATASATTQGGPPPAPTNLTARAVSSSQVNTQWSGSSGAASYTLDVSTTSLFSTIVSEQTGITTTSFSVRGLSRSTRYYFRVEAVNSSGTSGWSNTASAMTKKH